ncbi:glycosyltransferase family 4 protein [Rathayibacter sp. Leaf248]|nr:glycosyltransferase [Rathayibacter sp. Leaf248]
MVYFTENYDLDRENVPDEIQKISLRDVWSLFWRSTSTVLEMPEPLWMRFLPKGAVIAAAFRLTGHLRRRPRTIVTYAMENNDLPTLIGGVRPVPRWVARLFGGALGLYMTVMIDRIAFASEGSRSVYHSIPLVGSIENVTVQELPSASAAIDTTAESGAAVFIGVLETRKGIEVLLDAWELVESASDGARLTIIGPGPLSSRVGAWADESPSTRLYEGRLPRTAVLDRLRDASVLVAPSLPHGRWREQIGLPIKEALAQGLTIVTTRQTGLADWLAQHGHHVVEVEVDESALVTGLAASILEALRTPLSRSQVRSSLPARQGRYVADEWLHRGHLRGNDK